MITIKGVEGDAINALPCGAVQNLRMILRPYSAACVSLFADVRFARFRGNDDSWQQCQFKTGCNPSKAAVRPPVNVDSRQALCFNSSIKKVAANKF